MKKRQFIEVILCGCMAFLLGSCKKKEDVAQLGLNLDDFYRQYNSVIKGWLDKERLAAQAAITEKQQILEETTDPKEKKRLVGSINELKRSVAKF